MVNEAPPSKSFDRKLGCMMMHPEHPSGIEQCPPSSDRGHHYVHSLPLTDSTVSIIDPGELTY